MVLIYVMREDVKYEGTHTYIGDRAKIFDQYGLIIIHRQCETGGETRLYEREGDNGGKTKREGQ